MANYVANYTKKLKTLARKKRDLKRVRDRACTEEVVAKAAEAVRASQIRALEAKKAQVPPCEANADRIRAIELEIETCKRFSIAEVIAAASLHPQKSCVVLIAPTDRA